MTDIKEILKEYSTRFNAEIAVLFNGAEGPEARVVEAMRYSVMNGGKRLRPYLVYASAGLFGKSFEQSFQAAASLEMLHSYSLIHDDLPAMDNDDLRRGKPTCHKQFDEATAILAGDGLLTYAFELLAKSDYPADVKVELIKLLSQGAGAFRGMVAGQMLDLYAEKYKNPENPVALINHIEEMKTGCLLSYACEAGAVIGGADAEQRQILLDYSRKIGVAFQIADDILDAEGNPELVGKTLNKDKEQNKLTFVSCYGVEKARRISEDLIEQAIETISFFGSKSQDLQALARFIVERNF